MSVRRRRDEERLLGVLAAGGSVEQAAQAAGVSERTAYRRLADAEFRGRLASLRDELAWAALAELAGCASEAVATLRRLLDANSEQVQLGAARTLLDQLLRLREALELSERLTALERRVNEKPPGRRAR